MSQTQSDLGADVIRLLERMDTVARDVSELRIEARSQREASATAERAVIDAAARLASVSERVAVLESWQTWAVRIVVSAVIVAVLGVVIGVAT